MEQRTEYRDHDFFFHHTCSNTPKAGDESFKSHFHDRAELYYFYGGCASYAVEGRVIPLERGTLIVIAPGQAHNLLIRSESVPYERMAILVRPEATALPPGKSIFVRVLTEKEQAWMEETVRLIEESDETRRFLILRAATELILTLAQTAEDRASGAADETVNEIIRFVNRHLFEEWTLDDLAKTLYRDKAYLIRRFKRVMGCGIWEYTLRKRIFAARSRLLETGSVSEAFALSGFSDYSSFYRRYRKTVGVSPSEDLREARK